MPMFLKLCLILCLLGAAAYVLNRLFPARPGQE